MRIHKVAAMTLLMSAVVSAKHAKTAPDLPAGGTVNVVIQFNGTPTAAQHAMVKALGGEQAQVDWAHFGEVAVGRARRKLSCFVATLSYSRALYLEFFFDQSMEGFLVAFMRKIAAANRRRDLITARAVGERIYCER